MIFFSCSYFCTEWSNVIFQILIQVCNTLKNNMADLLLLKTETGLHLDRKSILWIVACSLLHRFLAPNFVNSTSVGDFFEVMFAECSSCVISVPKSHLFILPNRKHFQSVSVLIWTSLPVSFLLFVMKPASNFCKLPFKVSKKRNVGSDQEPS